MNIKKGIDNLDKCVNIENDLKPRTLVRGSCDTTARFLSPKIPNKPHLLRCGKRKEFFDIKSKLSICAIRKQFSLIHRIAHKRKSVNVFLIIISLMLLALSFASAAVQFTNYIYYSGAGDSLTDNKYWHINKIAGLGDTLLCAGAYSYASATLGSQKGCAREVTVGSIPSTCFDSSYSNLNKLNNCDSSCCLSWTPTGLYGCVGESIYETRTTGNYRADFNIATCSGTTDNHCSTGFSSCQDTAGPSVGTPQPYPGRNFGYFNSNYYYSGNLIFYAPVSDGGSGTASCVFKNNYGSSPGAYLYSGYCYSNDLSGVTIQPAFGAYDNSGNYKESSWGSVFYYDGSAPSLSASNADTAWYNSQRTATLSASDSGSGLDLNLRYSWGTALPSNCASGGTLTSNGVVLNAPYGGTTLYLCVKDNLGNTASWSGNYNWENSPPVLSASNSDNTWYDYQRSATVSSSDSVSGLSQTRYSWTSNQMNDACTSGGTATSNGAVLYASAGGTTLFLCARDNAGNTASWNRAYNWEETDPSVGIPAVYSGNFYNNYFKGTIGIRASVSDSGGSGISSCVYTIDNFLNYNSASYDGTYCSASINPNSDITLNFQAVDAAGNSKTGSAVAYYYDITAPALSATGADTTWYNTQRSALISASDSGAGLNQIRYNWGSNTLSADCTSGGAQTNNGATLSAPAGGTTLYLCARDNLGNTITWNGVYNWEDNDPSTTADGNGYTFGTWTATSPVSVSLSCLDTGGSGCAASPTVYCTDTTNSCIPGTSYSSSVSIATEGVSYIRYFSTDIAGNTETVQSQTIQIDTTAPTYTWNTPAVDSFYKDGNNINVDASITEAGAGISNGATCNAKIDGATSGFAGSVTYNLGTGKCAGTLTVDSPSGLSDGNHQLSLQTADSVGNSAASSNRQIKIDNTSPITAINDTNSNWRTGDIYFTLSCSDGAGAGCANRYYKILDGDVACTSGGYSTYASEVGVICGIGNECQKSICYYGDDGLGNAENFNKQLYKIDNKAPVVSVIYPFADGQWFNSNTIEINYSVTEANIDSCWWTSDSGVTNSTLANCANVTGQIWIQGATTIIIYANDSANNIGSATRVFNIDTIIPGIGFAAPTEANNSLYNRNNIKVNVTASDSGIGLAQISIYLINSSGANINSSMTGVSPNYIDFAGLADGNYSFVATAEDGVANLNTTEIRYVTIDTTAPSLTIDFPSVITYPNPITALNYTVGDIHLESCWFFNGTENNTIACGTNITTNLMSNEGSNTWIVYANDSVGNLNTTSIIFNVDTTEPNITIINPINDDIVGWNVVLRVQITDINLDNSTISYEIRNSTATLASGPMNGLGTGIYNASFNTNDTWPYNFSEINSTNFTFVVYANDTLANDAIIYSNFTLDNAAPTIQIINPIMPGTSYFSNNFSLDIQFANHLLNYTRYNITNSSGVQIANGFNESFLAQPTFSFNDLIVIDSLADGIYNITVYAEDSVEDLSGPNHNTMQKTTSFVIDRAVPQISIISPANANYTSIQTSLDYTVADANIQNCWWTNDSGITNNSLASCGTNASGLSNNQESNTWTVYARDSAGNINSSSVTFFVDSMIPQIQYETPTDNGILNRNNSFVNISATDANLANITTRLYDASFSVINETTVSASGNLDLQFFNLVDGTYYFNSTACDAVNLCNSTATRSILIDTTAPALTINNPNSSNYTFTSILINISFSDSGSGISSVWFFNGTDNQSYVPGGYITFNQSSNTVIAYANDSAGNLNTTSITFFVDSIIPGISIVYPSSDNQLFNANNTEINYTAYDSGIGLNSCWWTSDSGITNNTLANCGTNITGQTWSDGLTTIIIYTNDSLNNVNFSTRNFNIDTIAPVFADANETPSDPANYSSGALYEFTINVTGTPQAIWYYFNGTNYSNASLAAGLWRFTKTDLAAGFYEYIWYANDSAGNINQTQIYNYTVSKSIPTLIKRLNGGIDSNLSVVFPQTINASGSVPASQGILAIYNNGNIIANGASYLLGVNYYQFDFNVTGNQNYTDAYGVLFANVTKGTGQVLLQFSPGLAITFGNNINASCSRVTGEANARLERDGNDVTAGENSQNIILGAANYTYNCSIAETQNYTYAESLLNLTINRAPQTAALNLTAGLSLIYENLTNATCNGELYRNNANVTGEISQNILLGAANYNYSCKLYESQNLTYDDDNITMIISQKTPELNLTITPGLSVVYPTATQANGTNCPSQLVCNLSANNIYVDNNHSIIFGANSYDYVYNTSGNTNYTAASVLAALVVNKNITITNVSVNPASPIGYGNETNLSCLNSAGLATVMAINGADKTAEKGINITRAANNYTVNCSFAGDENYTATSEQIIYTINKAAALTSLIFDKASAQTYNASLNATCSRVIGETAVKLERNNVDVTVAENSKDIVLGASAYSYNCSIPETENYTAFNNISSFTINKDAGVVFTYLNDARGNATINETQSASLNATIINGTGLMDLYLNGNIINSGITSIANLTAFNNIGVYNVTAYYYGDDNHTADSDTFFVIVNDIIAPSINLTYPANTTYTKIISELNYSVYDNYLQACWYSLNGGTTNTTITCGNNATGLTSSQGTNIWLAGANDSAGNINSSSATFFVDSIAPNLTIISPQNIIYYNNRTILVNITNSSDAQAVWFSNGTMNITYNAGADGMYANFAEGADTLAAYANDSFGNLNETTRAFTIILERRIQNSTIYGNNYALNLSEEISGIFVMNSTINRSTIAGAAAPNITDSYIYNSVLTNVAYIYKCTVIDSSLTGGTCINLYIDPSNITNSDVTGSVIRNSNITDSNATNSNVNNSGISNSNVNNSIVLESNIVNSTFFNANATNSTLTNATIVSTVLNNSNVANANITNSVIINSNVEGSIIVNANISNNIVYSGNITVNGTNYSADSGPLNLTIIQDLIPPLVVIISPTGMTYSTSTILINITNADAQAVWYSFNSGAANNSYVNAVYASFTSATYTMTAYANDTAGNSNQTNVTFIVSLPLTPSEGAAGSGGGGGGAVVTFAEKSLEGEQNIVLEKQVLKFFIGEETHYLFIDSINATAVRIKVRSELDVQTLNIGDEKKFEINGDNYYDLYVRLNGIIDGKKANLTIMKIHELIPAGALPTEQQPTGENITEPVTNVTEVQPVEGKKPMTSYWIIGGVIAAALIAGAAYYLVRRKKTSAVKSGRVEEKQSDKRKTKR